MKITVSTTELKGALKKLKVVDMKEATSHGVLVRYAQKQVELLVNNGHTQLTAYIEGDIEQVGSTIIPEAVLKTIEKLKDPVVTITDTKLLAGSKEISYTAGNIDSYVEFKTKKNNKLFTVTTEELKRLMEVSYAVSNEDYRPILKGINIKGNKFCALDGYRLSLRTTKEFNCKADVTMTPDLWKTLLKLLNGKSSIDTYYHNNHLIYVTESYELIGAALEGDYMKYESLISDEYNCICKVDQVKIAEELEFTKGLNTNLYKLNFTDKLLTMITDQCEERYDKEASKDSYERACKEADTQYYEALESWKKKKAAAKAAGKCFRLKEPKLKTVKMPKIYTKYPVSTIKATVDCSTKFENKKETSFDIAFNPKYLTDAVGAQHNGMIDLKMRSRVSPIIITKDDENLELILPVRLLNN